jgi:hypothetical protein
LKRSAFLLVCVSSLLLLFPPVLVVVLISAMSATALEVPPWDCFR